MQGRLSFAHTCCFVGICHSRYLCAPDSECKRTFESRVFRGPTMGWDVGHAVAGCPLLRSIAFEEDAAESPAGSRQIRSAGSNSPSLARFRLGSIACAVGSFSARICHAEAGNPPAVVQLEGRADCPVLIMTCDPARARPPRRRRRFRVSARPFAAHGPIQTRRRPARIAPSGPASLPADSDAVSGVARASGTVPAAGPRRLLRRPTRDRTQAKHPPPFPRQSESTSNGSGLPGRQAGRRPPRGGAGT